MSTVNNFFCDSDIYRNLKEFSIGEQIYFALIIIILII